MECNRAVHYQVFSPKGIIESKTSFRTDDPYTGRVIAAHITPPRSAKSIKTFLCDKEDISDVEYANLMASALSNDSNLCDEDYPPILARLVCK
jgi:hypothetical protein